MSQDAKRGPLGYVVLVIGVAMSAYHVQIAYTGGYEPLFQRALSYLFGLTLIFILHRRPTGGGWGAVLAAIPILLAVVSAGYPIWEIEYFLDRLYYVDPLRSADYVLGITIVVLTLEAARRTINLALPLIALFFLIYSYNGIAPYLPWEFGHGGASFAPIRSRNAPKRMNKKM